MMRHSHWVPFRPKAESKGFISSHGGMALCHRIAIITRVSVQTELFSIHLPTLEGLNPPPHDHLFSCCTPAKEDGHYSSTILPLNHEYGWCFPPASYFGVLISWSMWPSNITAQSLHMSNMIPNDSSTAHWAQCHNDERSAEFVISIYFFSYLYNILNNNDRADWKPRQYMTVS